MWLKNPNAEKLLKKGMPNKETDSQGGFLEVLRWIKFGPGVIGRTIPLMIVVAMVFGVAIYRIEGAEMIFSSLILLVIVVLIYLAGALWYANKHPDFSTLDGRTLVDYRRAQISSSDSELIEFDGPLVSNNPPEEIEGEE